MKQIIKGKLSDIQLISGYLHDALITFRENSFDEKKGEFSIEVERICYEAAQKRKWLFIFTVFRYPTIQSKLTFTNIIKSSHQFIDKRLNTFGDQHRLLDVDVIENKNIKLEAEHLKITLTGSGEIEILIEDISEPSKKYNVTDFLKPIFGIDKINELKTNV